MTAVGWVAVGAAIVVAGVLASWAGALVWAYRSVTVPPSKVVNTSYLNARRLGPYYVSLLAKLGEARERDQHGGVLYRQHPRGAPWLHPTKSAHHALAHYERYLAEGRAEDREELLRVAEALVRGAVRQADGTATWPYHATFFPDQRAPWLSAMGQGQAIAVLCRAWEESGDERFLATARSALGVFLKEIANGGVRCVDPRRGVFFEEYAFFEEGRQHHTLNGMMAALFGVYDLWKVTGDELPRRVFDEGVATIRGNLMAYHFPFCSSYDLRHEHGQRPLFQARYHIVHVCHLRILAGMTGDGYFAGVADVWERTLADRINRLRLASWYLGWKAGDVIGAARSYGVLRGLGDNAARLLRRWRR